MITQFDGFILLRLLIRFGGVNSSFETLKSIAVKDLSKKITSLARI